jgi:2-polyprenyl-3-methyl-5-hydroxy-6-metoxy-1,4-benzoquinol methylase
MDATLNIFRKIRIWRNKKVIDSFSSTDWMKLVAECQKTIQETTPHPHYINQYRSEEIHYWYHIPKWILEVSQSLSVKRSLDIGCAYGTLSLFCKRIFDSDTYCIDFVDSYLSKELISKENIHFRVSNIELDPFPWDGGFEIIIFTEVLEHLNFHPVTTLKKIRSLLSDNGILYLSTPDASQWGKVTKYYPSLSDIPNPRVGGTIVDDHVWQYEKSELLKVIGDAGFGVARMAYSPGTLNRHFNLALVKKV